MADEIDAAANIEELQRRVALDGMRRAIAHQKGIGLDDCEDCEWPIPDARKQAVPGATRCTPCQGLFDNQNRAGR